MLKDLPKHAAISLLYLLLGLSLGCYYTATYFGRSGWPLPSCEAISGVLLYYFSVINASTEVQAVHWMAAFLLAGYLWIVVLWFASRRILGAGSSGKDGCANAQTSDNRFAALGLSAALGAVPLSLPIPFMVWWMGSTDDGFSWSHFVSVCLRHAWVNPPVWLNYVYFGLGLAGFVLQIALFRRIWHTSGKRFFATYGLAIGVLLLSSIGVGLLVSYPLRTLLTGAAVRASIM